MKVRLFSMPGSHAATTGQLLFDHKGVSYKRTDLLPVVSWVVLKALRFPEVTVPAAKFDGDRVQGTRAIARELERRKPEPPLFPADVERRRVVEEAERFGDEELQQRVREIFLWSARKDERPAGRLATQIVRHFPGRTPAVLPPEWLELVTATAG